MYITKEKRKEYEKRWREKNPEKVKAQKERYYARFKKKIKERVKNYYWNVVRGNNKVNPNYSEKLKKTNQQKKRRWLLFLNKLRVSKGGQCERCGYKDEIRILQFHHLKDKQWEISSCRNYKKAEREAKKCILVCPNCHAIIHLSNNHL